MRVVVLGAGALGAAVALALSIRGARVTHIESERPGAGTTSRGAGLVGEALWHPASIRLAQRSLEMLDELSRDGERSSHPFRFHTVGSTTLLAPRHVPAARALARMQAREGVPVREVEANDLVGLPRHAGMRVDDVALGLHYPRDGWALPRLYAEVCSLKAQLLGARHVRGEGRIMRDERGVAVWAAGERHEADAVVVACGVWTRRVLREAKLDAPLLAYRTQALRLPDPRAESVPNVHDLVQGLYLRPGLPRQLVAGDGTTTAPEDLLRWRAEADEAFVAHTLRRLTHRFPYLAGDARAVEAWAGIEAATPDRLLLAGPHPHDPRVWLLAGGNGHGFMRAPAAGESLAERLLGERPRVDLAPFDPARFPSMDADFPIREGFAIEGPALK